MPLLSAEQLRTLAGVLDSLQDSHDNHGARVTGPIPFLVEFDSEDGAGPLTCVSIHDHTDRGYVVEVSA